MLIGTADVRDLVPDPPTLDAFATEPVELPGATVLQLISEIQVGGRETSLPPGLHPTNPVLGLPPEPVGTVPARAGPRRLPQWTASARIRAELRD